VRTARARAATALRVIRRSPPNASRVEGGRFPVKAVGGMGRSISQIHNSRVVETKSVVTNAKNVARRGQVLEMDEYIGEVAGSTSFATTAYTVNPGQSAVFPWGNKIASLYEKYEFEMLEFYFQSEVSGFATQGTTGCIILSADYDASDSPPTSKQNVIDTHTHTDPVVPSTPVVILRLDPRVMRDSPAKYVRPGLLPANTDIKTYDAAVVYVTTQGCQNAGNIGELHVRYRVKLVEPVLETGTTQNGTAGAQLLLTSALVGEAAAATTVYAPLFASATNPVMLANGIGATVASTGLITLLAGEYLLELFDLGTDTAAALTASTLEFNNVVTPNTGVIQTSGAGTLIGGDVSTHNDWQNSISMIWNTANFGTALCAQSALTYASGSALNRATLRITQL
jgi:hypothetical protein